MKRLFLLFLVLVLALLQAQPAQADDCDSDYSEGSFHVCYYAGTELEAERFLGQEDEPALTTPVAGRTFGINHDWGSGAVFDDVIPANGGAENDISAVWRGRLYFSAGRYQFTTFNVDGARFYIDEQPYIDEWQEQVWWRFGAVATLEEGWHDIRLEWYVHARAGVQPSLRLHWDRVLVAQNAQASPIVIDAFILKEQPICIAGDPWVSGEPVNIYNPAGPVYASWQQDEVTGLPRTFSPSDPTLGDYALVECFNFGYSAEDVLEVRAEIDKFARIVEQWSGGELAPVVNIFELEGPVNLGRIGRSWWIPPWELAPLAAPHMTTDSDFALSFSSPFDLETGRSYDIFGCGATFGVDQYHYNFGGTGYSWAPCFESLIILHEWQHQLTAAMHHLLGFNSLYPDFTTYPSTGYPACGQGDADPFKWFPDSHDWGTDPDSPWCGPTDVVGISELHLFSHFDGSLAHYPLGYFTGNHCDNGVQDMGESGVDSGDNCPATQVDTEPPRIRVTLKPNVLWPANHKYVTVRARVKVLDNVDADPTVSLVSVVSDEPDNGPGDGNTVNDIKIINDFVVRLRAERSTGGDGRVYTFTYQATDDAGNSTTVTATVTVPRRKPALHRSGLEIMTPPWITGSENE